MAKIIILEGSSTSGKSTIQKKLAEYLTRNKKSFLLVDEAIITNSLHSADTRTINGSHECLKKVIQEYFNLDYDYIIFDRFHFTHIITLRADFEKFQEIDTMLTRYDTKLVYFHYSKASILDRIAKTLIFRDNEGYKKHYNRIIAGTNSEEEAKQAIYNYYSYRLERYEELITKTNVNNLVVNTTQLLQPDDFNSIIPEITRFIEI